MILLRFQSTLPVWGATVKAGLMGTGKIISIHAPRVGSDEPELIDSKGSTLFQSTLPVWGATRPAGGTGSQKRDFNPRSPCGERQDGQDVVSPSSDFNPRSPCGERRYKRFSAARSLRFQSTLPVWGATKSGVCKIKDKTISIHAPRVGSDMTVEPVTLAS